MAQIREFEKKLIATPHIKAEHLQTAMATEPTPYHNKVIGHKDDKGYEYFPRCSSCANQRCKTQCLHTKIFLEKAEEKRVTEITFGPKNGKYLRIKSIGNTRVSDSSGWKTKPNHISYFLASGLWTQTQLYRDAVTDYEANH